MLNFERDHPQEAQKAIAEFEYMSANAKKPKLVSLTPADVDRIVKNKKTIPLDTVELLRLEEAENEMLKRQTPQVDPNPHKIKDFDFKNVPLVYGGGNPDTYELEGEKGDHRNNEYRVVRTDTFYPGQKKETEIDENQAFEMEAKGINPADVPTFAGDPDAEEDYDDNKEKQQWDDWKDEHPTGIGNKPRLV